jgi:hypothetical protein
MIIIIYLRFYVKYEISNIELFDFSFYVHYKNSHVLLIVLVFFGKS